MKAHQAEESHFKKTMAAFTGISIIAVLTLSFAFTTPAAHADPACDVVTFILFYSFECTDPEIVIAHPPPIIEKVVGYCSSSPVDELDSLIEKRWVPRSLGLMKYPLYHYTNGKDHYYTIHRDDAGLAAIGYGPGPEGGGQICNVADPRSAPAKADAAKLGLLPLHRYYGDPIHYYTIFDDDVYLRGNPYYHPDGDAGYIFDEEGVVGTYPLFRLFDPFDRKFILSIHPDDYGVPFELCEWVTWC